MFPAEGPYGNKGFYPTGLFFSSFRYSIAVFHWMVLTSPSHQPPFILHNWVTVWWMSVWSIHETGGLIQTGSLGIATMIKKKTKVTCTIQWKTITNILFMSRPEISAVREKAWKVQRRHKERNKKTEHLPTGLWKDAQNEKPGSNVILVTDAVDWLVLPPLSHYPMFFTGIMTAGCQR